MAKQENTEQQSFKMHQYNHPVRFELSKVALIVVDMQNDFILPQGIMAKQGHPLDDLEAFVERVASLMKMCKGKNIPIIATRHIIRENVHGQAVGGGIWVEMRPFLKVGGLRQGTWGAEIIDGLPVPDYIIDKPRFSAFYGTSLECLLRGLHTEVIIFSGVATNVCVESTIRDAFFRDFRVITIEDCVAAFTREAHEASLPMIRFLGAVISLNELSDFITNTF